MALFIAHILGPLEASIRIVHMSCLPVFHNVRGMLATFLLRQHSYAQVPTRGIQIGFAIHVQEASDLCYTDQARYGHP